MLAYCFVGTKGRKECSMQLVVSISICSFLTKNAFFVFVVFFPPLYFCSRKAPETTSEQNFSQKGLSEHMFLPGPMPSDGQGTQ